MHLAGELRQSPKTISAFLKQWDGGGGVGLIPLIPDIEKF